MARRAPRYPEIAMWGKTARKKMIDLDMTSRDLSNAIGRNQHYVSQVLHGQTDTAQETINLISDYLDIPNVYINAGEDN